MDLELDSQFLYNSEQNVDSLQALLETVLVDLNQRGECSTVVMDKFSLNLKGKITVFHGFHQIITFLGLTVLND